MGECSDWYKRDDDAFLFGEIKFNHLPKIYENRDKDDYAVLAYAHYGPTWGGDDLCVHGRSTSSTN